MSVIQVSCGEASLPATQPEPEAEPEISRAAIRSYVRLLRAVGGKLQLHVASDGGLICEDRRSPARPTVWRISADGVVEPDRPYNFLLQAFVASRLPAAV
jgi:hypothetical protein